MYLVFTRMPGESYLGDQVFVVLVLRISSTNELPCVLMALIRTAPGRVQELCESRGGRPGLPVLTSLMVSVDVKQH